MNFNRNEYRCPKKTNRIARPKYEELLKINKAKKPLNISNIKVVNPNFQPLNLRMLVAPIFFEPDTLGSTLLKIFDRINPDGIEPTK